MQKHDVPVAPVLNRAEALTNEHVVATGVLYEYDDPTVGRVPIPRPPAHLEGTPLAPATVAGVLGEAGLAILRSAGYTVARAQTGSASLVG